MSPRVVVIGGGLAGLAAAVEMGSRGARVTVVERNRHLGGKMNVLADRGFTFDMGPTILTLPQVVRGIIERSGRAVDDYLQLVRLDPQWRCFYEDGTRLDLFEDPMRMGAEIERVTGAVGEGARYGRYIDYCRRMMRLSEKVFFYKDLGGMLDLIRRPPPRDPEILRDVMAMRLHSTVAATAHRYIREPHLRQLVEHFMQYVGSSPFLAPAILSLIAAAQVDHGCWYAMGGTRKVAAALERILGEQSAEIITGTGVQRILTEGRCVRGVELSDGRTIFADAIVSNCDVQRTYREVLGDDRSRGEQRRIARRYTPACSGVVLYLGLSRRYDHLLHHNFIFSADSRREFDDIYARGVPAADPTLYLCAPSRTDPAQAPPGKEALYVLIHTPWQRPDQQWDGAGRLLESYRPVVIEKLKRHGMPDLERVIEVEHALTPQSIDRLYNAEGGAIYGLASHGRLHGGFKPSNRSRIWKGLYLCGGSVNPGPGVPMVLMSGVTAADAVLMVLGVPPRTGGSDGHDANGHSRSESDGSRRTSERWANLAAS